MQQCKCRPRYSFASDVLHGSPPSAVPFAAAEASRDAYSSCQAAAGLPVLQLQVSFCLTLG